MVVSVRFRPCCKIYPFETNGVDASLGMRVVAESEVGFKLGTVVKTGYSIEQPQEEIKKLLRIATEEDIEAEKNNHSLEEEARVFCIEKAKTHNLPMKIVATEATLDRKRLIFYFAASGRIDFRGLVRDLAAKFKTRIEMRQIGARDEVKLIGGIGACGRQTCCTLFLTSFEPVSIKMAKRQELLLNPANLSGICGRLMCCLGYEYKEPTPEEVTVEEPREEPMVVVESEIRSEAEVDVVEPETVIQTEIHPEPEISEIRSEKERGKPFRRRKGFFRKRKR